MKRPLVPCSRCEGCGKVELPYELWQTLQLVARNRSVTAIEVHRLLRMGGSSTTAANNRLEDLRRLGLLERFRGAGRCWHYQLASIGDGSAW